MGDVRPVVFTCGMPSFISSIEEEKVKLPRHLPAETTEVERSVTYLHCNITRSSSAITLNGEANVSERKLGWEEEQRSATEERDSGSDGAAAILTLNCGMISKSTFLNVNNGRVENDMDNDVDNANNGPVTERHIECGDCEKSNRQTGQEKMKSEQSFCKTSGLTTDECEVDFLTAPDECYYNRGCVSSKTTSGDAEHVYCTVYCIANDFRRNAVEISVESKDHAMETRSEGGGTGSSHESYSLSDLVDHRVLGDPVGVVVVLNCRVCLDDKAIAPLHCCQNAVCDECLKRYVSSELLMGKAHIPCPTLECSGFLEESLVVSHLAKEDVAKYHYLVELSQMDVNNKPCPKCSLFTTLKTLPPLRAEHKYKIQCGDCQFVWCFKCHAPWHDGQKCREYRKGDKLFRNWANDVAYGQRNAQRCPQCKIHIQRTEGCDHMTCTQCNTNFCYRCGERYRHLRFFGDHTSNLSVFGCRYRYLPEKPHLRRLVRGSVCVGKMMIAPVAVVLLLVLGALSLVIGLVALPVYYVCKKKKKQLPYWYW